MVSEPKAVFETVTAEPNIITLVDLCRGRSITLDAAAVVRWLYEGPDGWGERLNEHRIIYQDTTGMWDGIDQKDGTFIGFITLDAKTKNSAIKMAREHTNWVGKR